MTHYCKIVISFFTGFILPLKAWFAKGSNYQPNQWQFWFHLPCYLFSAALFFVTLFVMNIVTPEIYGSLNCVNFLSRCFFPSNLCSFYIRLNKLSAVKNR
jgi:hypothetical protein